MLNFPKKKKVTTSNVRGKSSTFSAENALDRSTDTYWATDDLVDTGSLTIHLGKPAVFNRFMVQEYIQLGQRVKSFTVEAMINGSWKQLAQATTIGYKRILSFPTVRASKVRLTISGSKASPAISNIGIYNAPQILTAPSKTTLCYRSRNFLR